LNRVVSGPLNPQQTVAPQGGRHTAVMQVSGNDKDSLAMDNESFSVKIDVGLCRRRRWEPVIVVAWPAKRMSWI